MEKIVEHAPLVFNADQLRLLLQILLNDAPYGLFEEAAEFYAPDDGDDGKTVDELLTEALGLCVDEKLTAFLLRLILSEHRSLPLGEQIDWLEKAAAMFVPESAKPVRPTAKKLKGNRKSSTSRSNGTHPRRSPHSGRYSPHRSSRDLSGVAFLLPARRAGRTLFGFSRTLIPLGLRPALAGLRGRRRSPSCTFPMHQLHREISWPVQYVRAASCT